MRDTFYLLLCIVYTCTCQKYGDFMADIRTAKTRLNAQQTVSSDTDIVSQLREVISSGNLKEHTQTLLGSDFTDNPLFDVSSLCLNHTKSILEGILQGDNWAQRIVDAAGKPSSDLLDLQLRWFGNFEECTAIEAVRYEDPVNKTGPSHLFDGKYCLTFFPLGGSQTGKDFCDLLANSVGPDQTARMRRLVLAHAGRNGMKIPEVASTLPLNTTIPYPFASCQEKDLEYSGKAIAVITVCSVFLAVMLIATTYDIIIQFVFKEHKYRVQPNSNGYGTIDSTTRNGHVSNGHIPNGNKAFDKHDDEKGLLTNEKVNIEYKPGLAGKLLLSFSMYTNTSKIFSTSQTSGILTSVNGVRFISMTWVILGHTYAFGLSVADNIPTYLPKLLERLSFQVISNATFAVDTFFVLSGLLVAYLTLREMKKKDGAKRFSWGMFYFHRYWRLTPPYMLVIMLYVPTIKYWATGPLWPQATGFEVDECKDTWWKNLLYVNNVIEPQKMCMAWSWYLANDMQFYIISPLMLIPLYYSPLWGGISCFILVLANFITTGVISKHNGLGSNMILGDTSNDSFDLIYVKPWCRIAPYVIGIFTGYALYVTDCKVKMSKILNAIGWVLATVVALLVLYGLHSTDGQEKLGPDAAALYNATSRTAWGLAIAWVIFACATGYGGPVNALLSWRTIIPLSRLTYCAYLVHPVVMYVYFFSQRTLMRWYDLELSYIFMGNICLTYAFAFIVSLAFESPMMGLEKALLGREKRS